LRNPETSDAKHLAFRRILRIAGFVVELVAIAGVYFGLAKCVQLVPAVNPTATPLWPPTGFALALVILRGQRIWPAILAGPFFASVMVGHPPLEAGFIAIGTLLAAFAGAMLIDRLSNSRKMLASPSDVATFVLVSFVPTALVSSSVAAASSIFTSQVSQAELLVTWLTWWLVDAAGTLLVAPVVMLWAMVSFRPFSKWAILEAAAIFALAGLIGITAYSPLIGGSMIVGDRDGLLQHRSLLGFLVLLPLIWASLRGNQRNAATAALIYCGFAVWGFSAGISPFHKMGLDGSLSLLLSVVVSTAAVPLVLAAAVAERRNAEARLQSVQDQLNRKVVDTNLALDSARRHFQILIEGVVDYAIFVLDTAGRVASWNSAAQRILGYSTDEIIGKHFGIFYRPDERRAGEPNRALEMAIHHGKHDVEGWRIRKNGTPVFVTGSVTVIRNNNENLIGFANIIRDTTERRDAHEKLVEAREQLAMAQKMEAIGKLTGGIAHDFNNLLMIIGGNAQIFKRLLDPKLPSAIEAIQTAAKHGESLTRQLLTFSRRQHLSPTVLDVTHCIRDLRPMIQSSLRGNIVYNEKIGMEVLPVKVDQAELELSIVNIAVNARDAMPSGGTFTISVGHAPATQELDVDKREGTFVAIAFSDSGTGIPPNLLSKIFDPFFTTKEVGKGSGLGLSQVYGFAHQAGGTVKVESTVGQGTTITVYLPLCSTQEIATKEVSAKDNAHVLRPTVLVVDDSAEVAQVTSSLFEHLGFKTVYRDSADGALKLLEGGTKFDLVFSDIVMPGAIDGVALAREIRSRYSDLPVILTTGYSDAAQAAPPDLPILRKPFDADSLKDFIENTMEANHADI
jgi:PAS domain S-box-containing protein